MFDLTGKNALVTGSSQGIGFGLARGLAEAGARVIINGRDPAKLATAQQRLRDLGIETTACAFDVTDPKAVEAGFTEIENRCGQLDILVANAGIMRRMPATEMPPETWREVLGTNLDGVWYCCQAAGKRMVPRGAGKIITICSVQSELGRPTIAPYATSKGALRMLTRTLCAEWAKHGVNVNGVAPGSIEFPGGSWEARKSSDPALYNRILGSIPFGRLGTPEEVANVVLFLASPLAAWVTGHTIVVDGGQLLS